MGGNSFLAGGYFALPDEDSAEARKGFVADFDAFCQKRGNVAIFETMAANALADVEWLRTNGVELLAASRSPTVRVSTSIAAPGPFAGMPNVFRVLRCRSLKP